VADDGDVADLPGLDRCHVPRSSWVRGMQRQS
jgi:hypothetical protein